MIQRYKAAIGRIEDNSRGSSIVSQGIVLNKDDVGDIIKVDEFLIWLDERMSFLKRMECDERLEELRELMFEIIYTDDVEEEV